MEIDGPLGSFVVEAAKIAGSAQRDIAVKGFEHADKEGKRWHSRWKMLYGLVIGLVVLVAGFALLFYLTGEKRACFEIVTAAIIALSAFLTGKNSRPQTSNPAGV